ncbi:MAG TPA: hypothetical protein VFF06_17570 [Polyangia bacterium]|nr:hypothetical protein [Polyangia bacterium]
MTFSACAGSGFPDVIDATHIATSFGAPEIERIRDAGSTRLPMQGPWRGESDGVAAPGELLLIEGGGFGRQPTISIGGRATAIAARTDGGGILVRVPTGAPVGEVEISVSQAKGRARKTFRLRRLAVVVHDDSVRFLEVARDGAKLLPASLALDGASLVRLSHDGSAAFVLQSRAARGDQIVALDLGAAGGPRVSMERPLSHRATALAAAEDAPVFVAVGEGKLTLFDAAYAPRPAPYPATALPKEFAGARAFELSPDGKVLAALVPEGNRLVVADVSQPPSIKFVTAVDLLPAERLPLVTDLAFSSDGETLWVVSGDNAATMPSVQPTRLTAVRLLVDGTNTTGGARARITEKLISVWRTQTVPGASAPLRLAIARGQPLASGTTIRMPPEKAAVFVTALADALFKLGELDLSTAAGAKAALKLWHPPAPGMMVRADINGGGGPLFTTPQIMAAVDLTPDAQLVVATSVRVSPAPATDSVVLDFGVTVSPIWGTPEPLFLSFGPLRGSSSLKPPFRLGEVKIQP